MMASTFNSYPNENAIQIIEDLVKYIEHKEQYKAVIQKLLDEIYKSDGSNDQKVTEADFQALLNGLANFANIVGLPDAKHRSKSEFTGTSDRKRIDGLFIPKNGYSSKTVIIHEYKKVDEIFSSQTVEAFLNKGLEQIYTRNYVGKPLEMVKEKFNWQTIIIRCILLYRDCTQITMRSKWAVQIKEYKLTLNQAECLSREFKHHSMDPGFSQFYKNGYIKDEEHSNFLKKILEKYRKRNINELWEMYSKREKSQEPAQRSPSLSTFILDSVAFFLCFYRIIILIFFVIYIVIASDMMRCISRHNTVLQISFCATIKLFHLLSYCCCNAFDAFLYSLRVIQNLLEWLNTFHMRIRFI